MASPVAWLPDGPTHTSTGTSAVAMRSTRSLEAGVAHDRAGAVELQHEGDGAAVLGLGDLRLDEVDEHLVEQPAHLDDGDVAVVRRLVRAPLGPRRSEGEQAGRDGYGGQTGPR